MSKNFENVLQHIGGFGRWQWTIMLSIAFTGTYLVFQNFLYVFAGAVPEHWCAIPELRERNWTTEEIQRVAIPNEIRKRQVLPSRCYMYNLNYADELDLSFNATEDSEQIECEKWEFDKSTYSSTITEDWSLVCERQHLLSTVQSTYMFGILTGSLVSGVISDKFGRRPSILISIIFGVGTSILTAFSVNYYMFLILRFFSGMGSFALYASSFVLLTEISTGKMRSYTTYIFDTAAGMGRMLLGVIGYFFRDWVSVSMAFSFPGIIFLVFFWLIPESPRWLLIKNRNEEAEKVLLNAARWNGCKTLNDPSFSRKLKELITEDEKLEEESEGKGCLHILSQFYSFIKTPQMRKRSLVMGFSWFVIGFVNYGMVLNFSQLPVNVYLVHVINGSVVTATRLFVSFYPIPNIIGRRPFYIGCLILAGLFGISVVFIPEKGYEWLVVTLTLTCNAFSSLTFTLVYLYTAELFPTSVRNESIGFGSVVCRIGGMIVPYLATYLSVFHYAIPVVIYGILSVITGSLCCLLPETNNTKLPESVDDVENKTTSNAFSLHQNK